MLLWLLLGVVLAVGVITDRAPQHFRKHYEPSAEMSVLMFLTHGSETGTVLSGSLRQAVATLISREDGGGNCALAGT